jgi:hypothetical protein
MNSKANENGLVANGTTKTNTPVNRTSKGDHERLLWIETRAETASSEIHSVPISMFCSIRRTIR